MKNRVDFCSESTSLLAKKTAGGYSRGLFVADGCGYHSGCLILVSLDCQGGRSRALSPFEGMDCWPFSPPHSLFLIVLLYGAD